MNTILEETEFEEYDSVVSHDVSQPSEVTSASEATSASGSPFLLDKQEYLLEETEQEGLEFDPYAGIRSAMAPEHANLAADEITLNLGRVPATLVLHQFLNSQELRQAANIRIPAYLKLVARLCREVAEHTEQTEQAEGEAGAEITGLSGSVGRNGVNRPEDVRLVQQLINAHLPVPLAPLDEDGACGPKTIFAIETYQQRVLGMTPPDGRVDPGGATFLSLTGGGVPVPVKPTPKPAGPSAAGSFPPEIIGAAQVSHATWKIPASVTLAQWAVESNWGRAMPSGSNNPFGIKAAAGQPYVETRTREVVNGQDVFITAKFRKFDSMNDAFDQHGKLLATAKPYAHARTLVDDPDAFADALTGVYATDPRYGSVLKSVMKKYNLYQYD